MGNEAMGFSQAGVSTSSRAIADFTNDVLIHLSGHSSFGERSVLATYTKGFLFFFAEKNIEKEKKKDRKYIKSGKEDAQMRNKKGGLLIFSQCL